jgi:ABC-type lipoprotein export system ATPase subunit
MNAPTCAYIHRDEQPLIDSIFRGEHPGRYYLVMGPQGTGKGTMMLE